MMVSNFGTIDDFEGIGNERRDLINLVIGAYRSIRSPVAYVSMPITSGKLLYDVLERKGVKTLEELQSVDPESLYNDIIKPNIEMGIVAADNLDTLLPAIAPSVFEGKKFRWSQREYMALWFRVIEERAREMHMTDGWEYSNGGVQEFTRAMEMQFGLISSDSERMKYFPDDVNREKVCEEMKKIRVFDLNKHEVRLDKGFDKVKNAIFDLKNRGFDASSLVISLKHLHGVAGFFYDYGASNREFGSRAYDVDYSTMTNIISAI